MNYRVLLVGAFVEIIELCIRNHYHIIGLIDNKKTGFYNNIKVICNDEDAKLLTPELKKMSLLIVPDKPSTREKLSIYYTELGFKFTTLISKAAFVSPSADIGLGTIIQDGANISAETKVGQSVKINFNCNIMHNSIIGNYTTIAPSAVVLGNTKIGEGCYIGANSTILPGIEVGNNSVIGAGSVVTKNVPCNKIVVGNPAKGLPKNDK